MASDRSKPQEATTLPRRQTLCSHQQDLNIVWLSVREAAVAVWFRFGVGFNGAALPHGMLKDIEALLRKRHQPIFRYPFVHLFTKMVPAPEGPQWR